jgi:hypothetical protein
VKPRAPEASDSSTASVPDKSSQPGLESIASLLYFTAGSRSHFTFPCLPSDFLSTLHATPNTHTVSSQLISISFLIRPRLGLVLSGVTRFWPCSRLPAYTRLDYCHSTRPPHQQHPRVPWPYSFTASVMSSSEDDQPLVKGTSRASIICLGDAALQSVSLLFD